MVKITLNIDGMACGMCEAHVNDAIRRALPVKKVTSSHKKGITEIIAPEDIPRSALEKALDGSGYRITDCRSEPWQKSGLFGRL